MIKKMEKVMKEFVYDFAKDGGAVGTLSMKAVDPIGNTFEEGLIIEKMMLWVETAVTSGGTPTITFGNTSDTDGFFVDVFAKVGAANAIVCSGEVDGALLWDSTADAHKGYRVGSASNTQDLVMVIGTAALTAGKIRVVVEGYHPGQSQRA